MNVQTLRSTNNPERLVCQAARGDYYGGYIGDTEYGELMEPVDYDEEDMKRTKEIRQLSFKGHSFSPSERYWENEARTLAFIEKELQRGHYGPFEHPQISFAVEGVPVFTERQLIRHRHLTFDVQSMRYADFADAPYTTPETLTDSTLNREDGYTELDEEVRERCRALFEEHMDEAFERYETLVDEGVPKEDARALLGLGTEVNLSVSGNARSFLHLLDMRRKADAQWSIRQMSEMMLDDLFDWMPTRTTGTRTTVLTNSAHD